MIERKRDLIVMMTKLTALGQKNKFLSVLIRISSFLFFALMAVWDEVLGFFRLCGIGKKEYKRLLKYKNIHQGKRCFIIATGPSLTIEDLEKLKGEYTFGMNSICRIYDQTDFRPTYFGIQDYLVYKNLQSDIMKYYKDADNIFVASRIMHHYPLGSKWNVFPLAIAYKTYNQWFRNRYICKFSDNAYRLVYDCFTITHSLIQLAVYMGFKEIYLIGADCSFMGKKIHFMEHGVKDPTIASAQEKNIAGYIAAKRYADQHGIKIYNVTRGGELEMFERLVLEDVLTE